MRSVKEQNAVAVTPSVVAAAAAASAAPQIQQLNVSDNSTMHIGPQFVSVTQNVHQDKVVKGRLLGLILEARGATDKRRLRCSVAVFICWALVVAGVLASYVAYVTLSNHPQRIDLEGVWHVVKTWAYNTTRGERIACAVAIFALVLCACAAGILAGGRSEPPLPDKPPHEWNITRRMWLAGPRGDDELPYEKKYLPLRMIIIQHTAGAECHRFQDCAALMKNLQEYYFGEFHYDVPYNFVIGNDARVYEGRGADLIGAHTYKYNRCSLGLGFTGSFANASFGSRPTSAQRERVMKLIDLGVERGLLHKKVMVLGARDVQDTESPGDALYAELRTWPQAPSNPSHFYDRYCDDIYQELTAPDSK